MDKGKYRKSLEEKMNIIDNMQTMEPEQMKIILDRINDNTKIVLIGEQKQVTNPIISKYWRNK